MYKQIFFCDSFFEVHYIWYQRKSYNTGPEQGHINRLSYIMNYEETNKYCGYRQKAFSVLCWTMEVEEGAEIKMEANL